MKRALLIFIGLVNCALAEDYFAKNTNAPARVDLAGSYGGQSFLNIPTTIAANVSVTSTSIFYSSYSISSSTTQTLVLSQEFPVSGTFEFRRITATLTLRPFVQTLSNFGPARLDYAFGSIFFISTQTGFDATSFQGEFTISGPNQTTNGTFSVTVPPLSTYRSMPHQQVDVRVYPDAAYLGGHAAFPRQ